MIYIRVKIEDKNSFNYIFIELVFIHIIILYMINQIKRGKFILKKKIPQKFLYSVIIFNKEGDYSIIDFDFNCYCIEKEIINSILFGKDVSKYYDLDNIKEHKRNKISCCIIRNSKAISQ